MLIGIGHIALRVQDISACGAVYGDKLGLREVGSGRHEEGRQMCLFRVGTSFLEVREDPDAPVNPVWDPDAPPAEPPPLPAAVGHFSFLAGDNDVVHSMLQEKGIAPLWGPSVQPLNHAYMQRSLVEFRDPNGFIIQVSEIVDPARASRRPASRQTRLPGSGARRTVAGLRPSQHDLHRFRRHSGVLPRCAGTGGVRIPDDGGVWRGASRRLRPECLRRWSHRHRNEHDGRDHRSATWHRHEAGILGRRSAANASTPACARSAHGRRSGRLGACVGRSMAGVRRAGSGRVGRPDRAATMRNPRSLCTVKPRRTPPRPAPRFRGRQRGRGEGAARVGDLWENGEQLRHQDQRVRIRTF
jgi:catechol 2,3-dioxygenase-like lactoylglutathione lyase family enzyme